MPYGRSFFYLRAVLLAILFAAVLLFFGLQTVTPPFWLGVIAAVLVAYLAIFALSPLWTHHTLLRSRLVLRQGLYFRAVVPFSDVEAIGPWDGEPKYGLRIGILGRTLFVVGSAQGLVSVRLREPRRFYQVLFLTAREIVFDVGDRDAFLAAVADLESAPPPLPAHKVLVLPPARR